MRSVTGTAIDINRIEAIVNANLLGLPASEKKNLPAVVSRPDARIFTLHTDAYLMISIVERRERSRLIKIRKEGISPFPELIKPHFVSAPTAFVIEKSKNVLVENCSVRNMFSISLGKDSTMILVNHKQVATERKTEVSEYTIELAFLVSYGNEIDTQNVYCFVEELIEYFVRNSRSKQ